MHNPQHPLHVVLLAGTVPLFLGGVLTDIAYFNTYEVQWKNFASWFLVGGLLLCGLTALWELVALLRVGRRQRRSAIHLLLLLAAFVLGLVNAFVHAADAWASMPQGLILSVISTALLFAALWLAIASPRPDGTLNESREEVR